MQLSYMSSFRRIAPQPSANEPNAALPFSKALTTDEPCTAEVAHGHAMSTVGLALEQRVSEVPRATDPHSVLVVSIIMKAYPGKQSNEFMKMSAGVMLGSIIERMEMHLRSLQVRS